LLILPLIYGRDPKGFRFFLCKKETEYSSWIEKSDGQKPIPNININ